LKDIAKEAEVSICTVSRFINNKISIKDETAEKIKAAIKRLDYIPNSAAKTLKTNSSKNVALLIPTLNNLVFAESANEIETEFRQNGYSVFIYAFENDIEREKMIIPRLIENRVAGVILNTLPSNYENLIHLRALEKNGIPYVFLNRMFSPIPVPSVYADYMQGSYESILYMHGRGRSRIALLLGRTRQPQSHANLIGYRNALKEAELPVNPDLVFECCYDHTKIPFLVRTAIENGMDAMYCMTDLMAIHAMNSVKALGKRVPEDIAIIGAGNTAFSTIIEPQLTSVDLQNRSLGRTGAKLLLDIMKKREYERTTVLSTRLVIRETA
jgi:DNA-binding LacI/PurR family transcriptional regulator